MENLQKYDKRIQKLQHELDELKPEIEENNKRLESSKKSQVGQTNSTLNTDIKDFNDQIDRAIKANNLKLKNAENAVETTKVALKQAIENNQKEAKENKTKAFVKLSKMNAKFNAGKKQGEKIKLKLKAFSSDKDNKDVYKAAKKEHADHMLYMKELARERNEAFQEYDNSSKILEKVNKETEVLLNKYDLGKTKGQGQPAQPQPGQPQPAQPQPGQPQPAQPQPGQPQPGQPQPVQSITINANTGKATIVSEQGEKEVEIEELIENKNDLYKRVDLDKILENKGKKLALAKALFKRKVNPVIVKAIESDEKMLEDYIDSLMDNTKELPFEYVHNLEDSSLSNKNARFMNRLGLREEKIKGAEVTGAEKFFGIKNFFRNIVKNKALSAGKQTQQLPSGQPKAKNLRNDPSIVVDLESLENARKARIEEIYNGLSEEQKVELSELSVQSINTTELQNKYGVSYNEAYSLVEAYGKKTNQNQPPQNQPATKKQDSGDTLTL